MEKWSVVKSCCALCAQLRFAGDPPCIRGEKVAFSLREGGGALLARRALSIPQVSSPLLRRRGTESKNKRSFALITLLPNVVGQGGEKGGNGGATRVARAGIEKNTGRGLIITRGILGTGGNIREGAIKLHRWNL